MNSITIVGSIAAILTTFSFVPQAIRIVRTKHTKDISLMMYIVFNTGILLWLIYGILLAELPIILANAVTICLTLTILIFKIKYN
jgi:MtN3 and saliva related transmembrane protein